MTEEASIDFLLKRFKIFLNVLIAGKDIRAKKEFIGQAIIQAARPRVQICPLQLGLAVQLRNQFQSRFVIEELSAAGFCSGYTLVTKYQKSAVVCRGTDITITSETDTICNMKRTMLTVMFTPWMDIILFMQWDRCA